MVNKSLRDNCSNKGVNSSGGNANPLNLPVEGDIEWAFGTTKNKIVVELFRINMGKPGYYLADLLERKYYYCGVNREDVRTTLLSLGIGRVGPIKS